VAESIEFRLKVIEDKLGVALEQNEKKAKSLGSALTVAAGTFAGGVALKGFDALGRAIGSVNDFIFDSIKASAEQEAALNRLGQALRNTGEFSNAAIEDFSAFAGELQKTSVYADEVVLNQLALAKSFGATNEQAKNLVQGAANLSASIGGTLEQNVEILSKSLNGLVGKGLKAAIPELKSLSQEALNSGAAIDLVNQKFGGSAQAQLNTYEGSLVALKNSFGELQEIVGDVVTQSEFVQGAFKFLTDSINSAVQAVSEYKAVNEANNKGFVDSENKVNSLASQYADLTVEIEKQQAIINGQGQNKGLVSTADIQFAETRVKALTAEAQKLFNVIQTSQQQIAAEEAKSPQAKAEKIREQTTEELNAIKERQIQISELEGQFALLQEQGRLEQEALKNESIFTSREEQLQRLADFEYAKTELEYQSAVDRAALLKTQEEKATAIQKSELIKRIANEKTKQKTDKEIKDEQLKQETDFYDAAISLSNSKNRTMAAIGKAFALQQLAEKTPLAIGNSYEFGTRTGGPVLGAVFGGIAAAAMAQQAARIAGVQGFAQGGIIGATSGADNRMASVRDGEMVLNASQQEQLFNSINNGAVGGNIVIQIDGRNIAYAVRDQVRQGFKLT